MGVSPDVSHLKIVYYCSGHGYGHATRVSAFASTLLSLIPRPTVYIVSSAPKHVFSDCIAVGALHRYAEIDPIIVQPLAYRVDRLKSVEALRSFLEKKDSKVAQEVDWLKQVRADCVLSDSAFLGCLAAKTASIPSVLITNFTFDSVYSYLSTSLVDETPELLPPDVVNHPQPRAVLPADIPIPRGILAHLVDEIHAGFRCADLLCLLPGGIPIPSFSAMPKLPSPDWVDPDTHSFRPEVVIHLLKDPATYHLHPSIPFPSPSRIKSPNRKIISSPLLVRPSDPSVYGPGGRSRFLSSLGIPLDKHDPVRCKILVVSFGGQVFHTPRSSTPSRPSTPTRAAHHIPRSPASAPSDRNTHRTENSVNHPRPRHHLDPAALTAALRLSRPSAESAVPRIATKSHIWIPGAPPAVKLDSPHQLPVPTFTTTPPTPQPSTDIQDLPEKWTTPRLLPDDSWIAIVCGASKESDDQVEDLPDGFYIAPKDVYMPDLTAVADVLLGKLGYGSVSECIDSCTPFVYVPRPLFIEEHGLRLLLEREGVGIELSRTSYEAGDWAEAIQDAWEKGREVKERRRGEADTGTRHLAVRVMAQKVVNWVNDWKAEVCT